MLLFTRQGVFWRWAGWFGDSKYAFFFVVRVGWAMGAGGGNLPRTWPMFIKPHGSTIDAVTTARHGITRDHAATIRVDSLVALRYVVAGAVELHLASVRVCSHHQEFFAAFGHTLVVSYAQVALDGLCTAKPDIARRVRTR